MKGPLAAVLVGGILLTGSRARAQESVAKAAPDDRGLRAEVAAGGGVRTLFGLDIWGENVALRVGGQIPHRVGGYLEASYFNGSTPAGLTTQVVSLGALVDVRVLEGLHLGCGYEGVNFDLARAPGHSGIISTWGLGLLAFARYDLFQAVRYAVFLEARGDYMSLDTFHNPAAMSGATLLAGVHF